MYSTVEQYVYRKNSQLRCFTIIVRNLAAIFMHEGRNLDRLLENIYWYRTYLVYDSKRICIHTLYARTSGNRKATDPFTNSPVQFRICIRRLPWYSSQAMRNGSIDPLHINGCNGQRHVIFFTQYMHSVRLPTRKRPSAECKRLCARARFWLSHRRLEFHNRWLLFRTLLSRHG